ncbi:MAG: hypothetical protein JSU04_01885 [Bdellovibrionales bacterium]|nr:hypothetical protein [Bdellovibrionales bacterium]
MLVLNENTSKQEQRLRTEFIALAIGLAKMLNEAGTKTQAGLEGFPHFDNLELHDKKVAIESLRFYHDLCRDQVDEGQPLRDSKKFTWRALVKLGLSPQSDFLDRIESGDIVELYNEEQVQLFRNLEFFDICSYTIEELFCIQWWRLFRRDEAVSKSIVQLVSDLFQRKYPNGVSGPLPQHLVVESISRDKFKMDFYMKYIGPLYKNKKVGALICIEQAALV